MTVHYPKRFRDGRFIRRPVSPILKRSEEWRKLSEKIARDDEAWEEAKRRAWPSYFVDTEFLPL